MRKIWKWKFRFRKKKLRLQYQYQNWILVSVSNIGSLFRWEPCAGLLAQESMYCSTALRNCIGRESKQKLLSFYPLTPPTHTLTIPPPPIKWLRNIWMVPFFSRRLLILIIRDSITKEDTIGVNKECNSTQKKTSNCFFRRIPKCFIIHLWKK